MNKKNILIVSNPEKMDKDLFNWIERSDAFEMSFADSHEQAVDMASQRLFDMVLVDANDPEINGKMLKAIMPILNAEVLLVGYKSGDADTIDQLINDAFEWRKMKRMQKLLVLEANASTAPPFSLN